MWFEKMYQRKGPQNVGKRSEKNPVSIFSIFLPGDLEKISQGHKNIIFLLASPIKCLCMFD